VVHSGGTDDYVVSGGFAEITADSVSVLAEQALPKGEVTQALFDGMLAEARAAASAAEAGSVDVAAKTLADMLAMGEQIGLSGRV